MKLGGFFDFFENLTDTSDALVKVRELILQLAARGKLVEQNDEDEPAAQLVNRIEKHFQELRQKGELRGAPVDPLDNELTAEIPATWEWVRLGNVVDYGSPERVESSEIPDDAWVLDLEDIEKDSSRLLRRKTFRESPSKSTKTAFRFGDVLYGKLRPYLNKVLVADAPGFCTPEIIPIRTFEFIDPAYLCYALRRPEFVKYANSKTYGMNLPRLGTEDARRAGLPLPPLPEQRRIVQKVDELMMLCDQLETEQQERDTQQAALNRAAFARFTEAPTATNLKFLFHDAFSFEPGELRKTILTLALRGKLVHQDSSDEAGAELQKRILGERRCYAEEHGFRLPISNSLNGASVPFSLPANWSWVRLSDLFNVVTDGDHLPPPKSETGIAFLTIGNITTGKLDFNESRYVPEQYYRGLADFRRPSRGDILYTVVGATYGRPALVDTERPFCVQRHIAILKPARSTENGFLMAVLRSPLVYDQATRSTTGIAQPTIPLGALRNFLVPLPPLAEQRRIAAKTNQLMVLVDQLEAQLMASRVTAANVLDALVAELTVTSGVHSARSSR